MFPFTICTKANPIPLGLEVSVRSFVSKFESNGYMTRSEVSRFFIFSNATFCSSNHIQAAHFLSSGLLQLVMCAKSGTNEASWFACSRNVHISFTVLGVGNCFMAANFVI